MAQGGATMTATRWDGAMDWARGKLNRQKRTSSPPLEAEKDEKPPDADGVCFSGQIWRKNHEYMIDSPEGTRCIYCRALRRMEPL